MEQEVIDKDPDGLMYRYLPQMVTFRKGSIDCLLALVSAHVSIRALIRW